MTWHPCAIHVYTDNHHTNVRQHKLQRFIYADIALNIVQHPVAEFSQCSS